MELFYFVAFGFCEYADPECTLRAMRLLNGFKLGDKSLVVSRGERERKGREGNE